MTHAFGKTAVCIGAWPANRLDQRGALPAGRCRGVGRTYWANYRSAYDPANTLARLVGSGPADPADRVIASDNITLDVGPDHVNSVSRNHLGQNGKPAGGNVLYNDTSAHWRLFEETKLRVQVPAAAPHQRDFYF